MNYTREELLSAEATMNQMRNAINHLIRFMEKNKLKDKKKRKRLREMGKNMGRTYVRYWKPTEKINLTNIKDVLATIYQNIVNSSISVELNEANQTLIVIDSKCSLCKYEFEDIHLAGCEIILAMVAEMVTQISKESKDPNALSLEPVEVAESRGLGHSHCKQIYKYKRGGT